MASNFNIDWGNLKAPDENAQAPFGSLSTPQVPSVPSLNFGASNPAVGNSLTPNAGTPSGWQAKWFGGTNANGTGTNGIIPGALGAFTGLANAYTGWQQFSLAKEQLAQNKQIFNLNFMNQAKNVNRDLEDRQRARVASNSNAYQSVGDYMKKNSVSEKGI